MALCFGLLPGTLKKGAAVQDFLGSERIGTFTLGRNYTHKRTRLFGLLKTAHDLQRNNATNCDLRIQR